MKNFFSSIQWKDHLINFIAVMVGVTIAFYLSNRKESSDREKLEKSSLESVIQDLDRDIAFLTQSTDTLTALKGKLKIVVDKLMANVALENADESFGILFVQLPFIPSDNTYQSLLASGKLDVIEDFSLRKQMTDLYHQHYQVIKIIDQLSSQQKNTLIYPYLMRINPLNIAGIDTKDPAFINANLFSYYYLTQKIQYDTLALESARRLRQSVNLKLKEL